MRKKIQSLKQSQISKSNDSGRLDVGMWAMEKLLTFELTFYSYDSVTKEMDYPIDRAFTEAFHGTWVLTIMFTNQIFLS